MLKISEMRTIKLSNHRCVQLMFNYLIIFWSKSVTTSEIKVGIVGAGISGLYSAILLQDLGIDYEILEASNRIGGRYHTVYFDRRQSRYNYIELGAMRYPITPELDRLIGRQNWSLISYLNSKMDPKHQLNLIPFTISHPNNIFHFNGKSAYRSQVETSGDLFGFGKKDGGYIDDSYTAKNSTFWLDKALDYIDRHLNGNLSTGFDYLLQNDYQTFRTFLMDPKNGELNYTSDVVDWIEDLLAQTGKFSSSFMEVYLQLRLFRKDMFTIQGGLSNLIQCMNNVLQKKPKLNTAVKKVKQEPGGNLVVETNRGQLISYTHLIVTPTFQVLRDIDFDCDLHLKKRIAMRTVTYAMSVKVGLMFRTRFWENANLMNGKPIFGGASLTDLRIREVNYPSYGINCTSCPGALLVSYSVFQDSRKLLIFSDKELVEVCVNDLAKIHGEIVHKLFTGKYSIQNWSTNKWTQGAFSVFEPGYFASYYHSLMQPEANGRLHFAGDTLSLYHNWSIGAVIAAFKAVKNILIANGLNDTLERLESNWCTIDETEMTLFN